MLQFDQNTPGGLPQGLAALISQMVQAPLDISHAKTAAQAQQAHAKQGQDTLAELVRSHQADEADRGVLRQDQQNRDTEIERHNRTLEANSINATAATNATKQQDALEQHRRTLQNVLAGQQKLDGSPAYTPEQILHMTDILAPLTAPTPDAGPSSGLPATPGTQDPATMAANVSAFGAANGVPAQSGSPAAPVPAPAATGPTNPVQAKLISDATHWLGLPSLVEGDKQKIRTAIATNNFDALSKMSRILQSAGAGNQ